MNAPRLSCDDVEALLPLVADGQLDETADPTLFAHLANCPHCAESLAEHDLITVALRPASAASNSRAALRLPRWLPAAAAACLIIGLGTTFGFSFNNTSHAPGPSHVAQTMAPLPATQPFVQPLAQTIAKSPAPIHVDVEVVAVPGSTATHPRYLVRRGEQVLLVDPTAAPTDTVPASYSVPTQRQARRY